MDIHSTRLVWTVWSGLLSVLSLRLNFHSLKNIKSVQSFKLKNNPLMLIREEIHKENAVFNMMTICHGQSQTMTYIVIAKGTKKSQICKISLECHDLTCLVECLL